MNSLHHSASTAISFKSRAHVNSEESVGGIQTLSLTPVIYVNHRLLSRSTYFHEIVSIIFQLGFLIVFFHMFLGFLPVKLWILGAIYGVHAFSWLCFTYWKLKQVANQKQLWRAMADVDKDKNQLFQYFLPRSMAKFVCLGVLVWAWTMSLQRLCDDMASSTPLLDLYRSNYTPMATSIFEYRPATYGLLVIYLLLHILYADRDAYHDLNLDVVTDAALIRYAKADISLNTLDGSLFAIFLGVFKWKNPHDPQAFFHALLWHFPYLYTLLLFCRAVKFLRHRSLPRLWHAFYIAWSVLSLTAAITRYFFHPHSLVYPLIFLGLALIESIVGFSARSELNFIFNYDRREFYRLLKKKEEKTLS